MSNLPAESKLNKEYPWEETTGRPPQRCIDRLSPYLKETRESRDVTRKNLYTKIDFRTGFKDQNRDRLLDRISDRN